MDDNRDRRLINSARLSDVRSPAALIAAAAFSFWAMQSAKAEAAGSVLATIDQTKVEAVALQVYDSAEVRQARRQVEDLFRADPVAATSAGRATLEEAVTETVFAAVLDTVADDPGHPVIVWSLNAPHQWHGLQVPGTRYGVDNPDNIYRLTFIDDVSHYVITGRRAPAGPAQFVFEMLDSAPGIEGTGKQLGILMDKDLKLAPDGSFTITVDPEPSNGRENHFQTKSGAKAILIRDTLSDWAGQTANELRIRRIDPSTAPNPEIHQLAVRSAEVIPSFASFLLDFRNHALFQNAFHHQTNTVARIDPRQGGWGYAAGARFKLAPDDALVIRVSPLGARYLGIQLADPWMISTDYIDKTGSFNNHQATADADGNYTYVIALQDPGVANWLNPGGVNEGFFELRWQQLAPEAAIENAIRGVHLVKLANLPAMINGPPVAAARDRQIADRRQSYLRRLGD